MIQNIFWGFVLILAVLFGGSFFGLLPEFIADPVLSHKNQIFLVFYLALAFSALSRIVKSLIKFERLNFYERIVVDRGGKLVIKRSFLLGYAFILKAFNYERELRRVNVGVEYSIEIYKDKEIWIDLKEGGKVTLISPKIWVKIEDGNVEKAVKTALDDGKLDFEELIGSIAATAISEHIRSLNVNEIMETSKRNNDKNDNPLWDVLEGKSFFSGLEEKQGVSFCGFTFKDFDFSDEVTSLRREEYKSILDKIVAKNKAEAEADKLLGSMIHLMANIKGVTTEEVKGEIKDSPELQKKFLDLYTDFKRRELTSVTDIRVSGHNGETVSDIKTGIMELTALFSGNRDNRSEKRSLGEKGEFSEK